MPGFLQRFPQTKGAQYLLWGFTAGLFFTHILLQIIAAVYFLLLITLLIEKRTLNTLHCLVILYVLSGILAFGLGQLPVSQNKALLPHLVFLSIIPLSIFTKSQKQPPLKTWAMVMTIFATLTAMIGIFYHFQGMERTRGFFGGYFTLAFLMACTIPFTMGVYLQSKSRWKFIYILMICLQLAALWWTYTRSAFLGLVMAISSWFFVKILTGSKSKLNFKTFLQLRWLAIFAIPVLLLVLMLNSEDPRLNPFAVPSSTGSITEDFSSGRLGIIKDAVQITRQALASSDWIALLFGHGLHSRQRLVDSPFHSWESDYLQVFMNQGMTGLLLVILIYVYFFKEISCGFKSQSFLLQGLAASGITFFTMSFFTSGITNFHSGAIFAVIYTFLYTFAHIHHASNK